MNNKYKDLAAKTFLDSGDREKNILHLQAGILGEYGEIVDAMKKKIFTPQRFKDNLAEEWADGMWYIAVWHSVLGRELYVEEVKPFIDTDNSNLKFLIHYASVIQDCVEKRKLGVLTHSWMVLASILNIDAQVALDANIKKLQERYG